MPNKGKQRKARQKRGGIAKGNKAPLPMSNEIQAAGCPMFPTKPSVPSPMPPAIPSGNPPFKNARALPDMKTSMRDHLPAPSAVPQMTPDGRKRPRKKPAPDFDENSPATYNAEICQLMNEFYHSPLTSRAKISRILEEVKNLNDRDTANSVFISVFQNIKSYMKEKRALLHSRLKDLGLVQSVVPPEDKVGKKLRRRRHSADSIYEYSEDAQEISSVWSGNNLFVTTTRQNCTLRPLHEVPERYIEFLISLCESYSNLIEITATGVEAICQEILAQCQPNNEVSGYDIHRSLFYDYVLKDRLIMMAVTNAQCYVHDDKMTKKYPKLKIAVGAIRKIKAEIRKCRVKITIGKGNLSDEQSPEDQKDNNNDSSMSYQDSSISNSEESEINEDEDESTKNPTDSQTYDQDYEFLTGKSKLAVPIYALPEEEIINFIENRPVNPKTAKKKRHKKKKNKANAAAVQNGPSKPSMGVPPLKGLKANPFTPDSSADRLTGTPHSKNGEGANIVIKDEEEEAKEKKVRVKPNIPEDAIKKMKERLKEQMKRLDMLFGEMAQNEGDMKLKNTGNSKIKAK